MQASERYMTIDHSDFGPFYDEDSRILILGSFPSVKSREAKFYYGHPQNRFWKIIPAVFNEEAELDTLEKKKNFLKAHHIALWDAIEKCDIIGSSDASIRNVVPTDLNSILKDSHIERIFVNGKTSEKYFNKYQNLTGRTAITLPSSSPANAAYSLERLICEWKRLISS